MMTAADLPGTIPVFPLPGALMLPRARLPLHIFEPRYLAMLDDTMKTSHRLIGMVQPREVPGVGRKTPALHRLCRASHAVLGNRGRALHDHAQRHLALSRAAGGRRASRPIAGAT
jgi:hypothetical protein